MVLPGIVVSLVGASTGYFIFNNPDKIKGRNSRVAWDNLVRYEKIYEENSEELTCLYGLSDFETFYKDLIHLQEMTVENLKMLRDSKDIDNLMAAIINLRIDTYTQLKQITGKFIDTLKIVSETPIYDSVELARVTNQQVVIQQDYIFNRQHITFRDTSIIKNLGRELMKAYTAFQNVEFGSNTDIPMETIRKNIIGTWFLSSEEIPVTLLIKKDSSGIMISEETQHPFTWKLSSDSLFKKFAIHYEDHFGEDWVLNVINCTQRILQYNSPKKNGMLLVGCRQKE